MGTQAEVQGTLVLVCPELSRWVDGFIIAKQSEGAAPGTIVFYKKKLRPFIDFLLNKNITTPDAISAPILREYIIHLRETHNPGGCHAFYRAMRTFLFWYEDEAAPNDWSNPIRKTKAPKVPEEILEPVPLDDVRRMVAACRHDKAGLRDRAVILALLDSGMRAGELRGLDLADFEPFSGELKIRKSKTGKGRIVFVGQRTRRSIRAWLKARGSNPGPLFGTRTGERLSYTGLRHLVQRLAAKAGTKTPRLHSFRRACALNLLRNGADILTVSRLLGHAGLEVMRRYVKQTSGDLQSVHSANSPADRMGE